MNGNGLKFPVPKRLWHAPFFLDLPFEVLNIGLYRTYFEALLFFIASTLVVVLVWLFELWLRKV